MKSSNPQNKRSASLYGTMNSYLRRLTEQLTQRVLTTATHYLNPIQTRLRSHITRIIDQAKSLALGELHQFSTQIVDERAAHNEHHTAVLTVGPKQLGMHMAIILPSPNKLNLFQEQVKACMNLPEVGARSIFTVFNIITKADLLLVSNHTDAVQQHKHFASYLNPKSLTTKIKENISTLTKDYSLIRTNLYDKTYDYVMQVLATELLGVKLTPKLIKILKTLDNKFRIEYAFLPAIVLQQLPQIQNAMKEIDEVCREFIIDQHQTLCKLLETDERNFLIDTIKKHYPHTTAFKTLTKTQLQQLADHQDIRTATFSTFALANTAHVIASCLCMLSQELQNSRISELRNNLRSKSDKLDITDLNVENKITLQAIYHYSVLKYSRFDKILRYTKQGVQSDILNIPKNSLIICDINRVKRNLSHFSDLILDRNMLVMKIETNQLPEAALMQDYRDQYKSEIYPEDLPILVQLENNELYLYGLKQSGTWGFTKLDNHDNAKILTSSANIQKALETNISSKVYASIRHHGAHTPFDSPESITLANHRTGFHAFGISTRKCPASNYVGIIAKHIILAFIDEFESCYENSYFLRKISTLEDRSHEKPYSLVTHQSFFNQNTAPCITSDEEREQNERSPSPKSISPLSTSLSKKAL